MQRRADQFICFTALFSAFCIFEWDCHWGIESNYENQQDQVNADSCETYKSGDEQLKLNDFVAHERFQQERITTPAGWGIAFFGDRVSGIIMHGKYVSLVVYAVYTHWLDLHGWFAIYMCVVFAIAQSQSNSIASFAEYSNYSQAQCPICAMFFTFGQHAVCCNVPGFERQMNMHVMLGEKVWGNNIINQSWDWFSYQVDDKNKGMLLHMLHLWCHTLSSARSTCITKPVLKTLCFWKRMASWLPLFNYIADLPVCNFCTLHWLSNASTPLMTCVFASLTFPPLYNKFRIFLISLFLKVNLQPVPIFDFTMFHFLFPLSPYVSWPCELTLWGNHFLSPWFWLRNVWGCHSLLTSTFLSSPILSPMCVIFRAIRAKVVCDCINGCE